MAILLPAIRGKLGETEYFEGVMRARDFVQAVRPPHELDDWASFSIEERMQRDPNTSRILSQIAPYLANNPDRFFGSIIVLIYEGEVEFEPISVFMPKLPAVYRGSAESLGFLSIDGGTLVVLDGQHRYLAMRMVLQGEVLGSASQSLSNDEVSVIFVKHQSSMKTRRIFNVVNRYAKPTGRADNIITSEDDGYAIVARRLLSNDQPLGSAESGREELVDWKSNTLSARSVKLTTLSAVYDSVKLILEDAGEAKLELGERPSDADIDRFVEIAGTVWSVLLTGMTAYRAATRQTREIPTFRQDDNPYALLFKPASQIALIDGVLRAQKLTDLPLKDIVARADKLGDWSMSTEFWRGVMVKSTGAIETGTEARRRMATLLVYLLAADKLSDADRFATWKLFNEARGKRLDVWIQSAFKTAEGLEDLPRPVVGTQYRVKDAAEFAAKRGEDA